MYSAHDISIYIIQWCYKQSISITHLKLQKLLYFIQGYYIQACGKRLVLDDFYAWKLGPVIPDVYSEYSRYSSTDLPRPNDRADVLKDDQNIIDAALKEYASISSWDLVEMSHQQDPWKYNHQIFGQGAIIPYASIKKYFGQG